MLFTMGLCLLAASLRAQSPLLPKDGEESDLDKIQNKLEQKERTRFNELQSGKKAVADDPKDNKELLAKAARWYAYRLTNGKYHSQADPDEKDKSAIVLTMSDLLKEVQRELLLPRTGKKDLNDNQKEYVKELSKELIKCLREVLAHNAKPLVRVNAVRMLAAVGEAGQEEVADTLAEIIGDPRQSDAVKLWAFRGLKELQEWNKPDESIIKDAKRETRALLALADYILRKPEPMPTAADEIEALRYVRREAVRALGQSRYAAVPKVDKAEGRTAWVLLRVARKDGLTPEPSISEQVEGAIGACHVKPGKDVQLDYVAHHVGAVAVDFINQANRAKAGTGDAGIAWKLYAARFHQALEELRTASKVGQSAGVPEYVDKLVKAAQDPVRQVWDGKEANATTLDSWLRDNPPKNTTVYKGVADSAINAAGASGN